MCACFLSHLLLLYIGRVHGAISGCTVLCEVHPASAPNKSLISDTVCSHLPTLILRHRKASVEVSKYPGRDNFSDAYPILKCSVWCKWI